ncbi:MAG: hypothetical protein VB112_08290 [Oscillospiraceae bacterium]|nr:hypothetical protein [Oscillospiraceae bacterium]
MEVKRNGATCGSASLTPMGLYMRVRVEYNLAEKTVLRAYLRGDRGMIRLGVPAPEKGRYLLARDMTAREVSTAGTPLEVLLLAEGESGARAGDGGWRTLEYPEMFFSRRENELVGRRDCLGQSGSGFKSIAIPYSQARPFPLVRYFCFAKVEPIGGKYYTIYSFDDGERPVVR